MLVFLFFFFKVRKDRSRELETKQMAKARNSNGLRQQRINSGNDSEWESIGLGNSLNLEKESQRRPSFYPENYAGSDAEWWYTVREDNAAGKQPGYIPNRFKIR